MKKFNNVTIGAIYMIISSLIISFSSVITKYMIHIPVFERLFFNMIIPFIILVFTMRKKKEKFFGDRPFLWSLRGVFGFLSTATFYYALSNLNLADASLLSKTSPFFVTFFCYIFLKEKVVKEHYFALIIAIAGSALIIKPGFNMDILPALSGIACGAFAGMAYTIIRKLKDTTSHNSLIFSITIFSLLLSLPFMFLQEGITDPSQNPIFGFVAPEVTDILLFMLSGVFFYALQLFLTLAYKYASATQVSIYMYSAVVFSMILGFLMFEETLGIITIIGSILIIGAAYINIVGNKRLTIMEDNENKINEEITIEQNVTNN